jgi:hypothetical protein
MHDCIYYYCCYYYHYFGFLWHCVSTLTGLTLVILLS